jgi:hypothetical protein
MPYPSKKKFCALQKSAQIVRKNKYRLLNDSIDYTYMGGYKKIEKCAKLY